MPALQKNETRTPRPVPGCDVRSLPISPQDAFVLSRIDGSASETDLVLMTGLSVEQVRETIDRLADLGAVTWDGMPPRQKSRGSVSQVAAKAMRQMEGPAVEAYSAPPVSERGEKSGALYDPAELDEDVEIAQEKRRRVLDLFYRLEELSYYELLGVEPTADKKAIKSAYYQMAGEFHPDKHFRKRLGSFKPKMEAIFSRLTQAHDTLTKRATREEYDAYLATQRANRQLEESIQNSARLSDAMAKELLDFVRTGGASTPPPASTPSRTDQAAVRPAGETAASPGPLPHVTVSESPGAYETVPVHTKDTDRARREALAARLGVARASRPPTRRSTPPPPAEAPKSLPPEQAAEDLRRRLHDRQEAARRQQVNRYVEMATAATERKDPAAAANAYRMALALTPEDQVLQQAFKEAEAEAATLLADGYLKQGAYEEKADRWKEAALSYLRAAEGMKDNADVQHRASVAMLRADMDLRRAADYASRAIALAPTVAKYRATLGQIYISAGMPNNARRELEAAAELAPGDATIASLLKAVRKGS